MGQLVKQRTTAFRRAASLVQRVVDDVSLSASVLALLGQSCARARTPGRLRSTEVNFVNVDKVLGHDLSDDRRGFAVGGDVLQMADLSFHDLGQHRRVGLVVLLDERFQRSLDRQGGIRFVAKPHEVASRHITQIEKRGHSGRIVQSLCCRQPRVQVGFGRRLRQQRPDAFLTGFRSVGRREVCRARVNERRGRLLARIEVLVVGLVILRERVIDGNDLLAFEVAAGRRQELPG